MYIFIYTYCVYKPPFSIMCPLISSPISGHGPKVSELQCLHALSGGAGRAGYINGNFRTLNNRGTIPCKASKKTIEICGVCV